MVTLKKVGTIWIKENHAQSETKRGFFELITEPSHTRTVSTSCFLMFRVDSVPVLSTLAEELEPGV